MKELTYNNESYIFIDEILLGTSQYLFLFNSSSNELKCIKKNTWKEYNIDSSFLPWENNKITIIEHFINKINFYISNSTNIDINSIVKSINKFKFYVLESDLKFYIKDKTPYLLNDNSLNNLDLFLDKTIEITSITTNIKLEPLSTTRPLSYRNKLYSIICKININNTHYCLGLDNSQVEFKFFIEVNNLSYKPLNSSNGISDTIIIYFNNILNEKLKTITMVNVNLVLETVNKFIFYLNESDLKFAILNNQLNEKSISDLNIFLNQTVVVGSTKIETFEPIAKDSYFQKEKKKKKFNIYTFIMIASVIIVGIGCYFLVRWFFDGAKTNKINDDIKDKVEVKKSDGGEAVNPPDEGSVDETALSDYWRYMKMDLISVDFDELLKINSDTVGWIKVNGTNINYPIVQSGDNDYYLHHAFNGSYNNAGWIFADKRNDLSNLSKNTIIYGHGRLDTTMFGSLKNILTSDWYNNSNNHIIKLSTPSENTLWQVFSVYSIEAESYYITTDFPTTNQYEKFLTTLKERSVFNFSADVNTNDKVLTLSTCQDNYNHRVVMHAKLIKKETRN